jgi:hypothetical protein
MLLPLLGERVRVREVVKHSFAAWGKRATLERLRPDALSRFVPA